MMKICERCGGAIMAAGVTYGYAGPVCSCAWQQPRIEAARPTDEMRAKWLGDALTESARMRALLERQWKADAALYAMPFEAERHEYESALAEHDAVHKAIGEFLTPNTEVSGD